mmetsp:Transcript_107038/g.271704  ORF Transcript_107038/g.271704 Transcript_107038/m.271704 type:complete len:158 (-) Transcript_107038:30-503(-)
MATSPLAESPPLSRLPSVTSVDIQAASVVACAGALRRVGHSMVAGDHNSQGTHGDFLRGWTAAHHSSAPFATNYHIKVPPCMKEVRFGQGRMISAERVFGRPTPEGATSGLPPRGLGVSGACWGVDGMRAAGQGSGRCDGDLGRVGVSNGRYGSRPL